MYRSVAVFVVLICFWQRKADAYFDEEEKKPVYLTAAVGEYALFDCDLEFPQDIPIPYILNWNKEGETVFSIRHEQLHSFDPYIGRIHPITDDIYPKFGKASINLTSIRESDAGWFECQILFPNRTPQSTNNGTWFYLTVNGGNLLRIPPVNQTIMEGSEAEFNCVKKDDDTRIIWYKDRIPIKELDDILQRSWVNERGSLTIRPTTMGDLGEYECEATNSLGEVQTAKAFLNVQYKAKVIYAPRDIHLPYGRSALLDCHFRANPPLTNLRWEKDGFLFDPYNVQGVFYRRNGSLYFSRVDESHSGYYTCTPYNELGTEGPSPSIHVIVQRPPVFIITPHGRYQRKLGESIEIPCDARVGEDNHKAIIVWYKKDGSSLPVGRYSIRDGNLTIVNIQEEDRGLYQCSATNEAATITAETELIVEDIQPRAPFNLTAFAYANSVHLAWMADPKKASSMIEYSVWYKPVDTVDWKTIKISSKTALEATISNLQPGREYEFMVLSKDDEGEGLFSKTLRVWTKGLSPDVNRIAHFGQELGPPRDIKVHATEDGYLVTWDPPTEGLEDLRLYIVRWLQGPRENLIGTAETKNTSFFVTELEEGYEYHFEVIAMSYNDYQVASNKISYLIPAYRRIRSLSIGLITGVGFLALIVAGVYFGKKKWCSSYGSNPTKPN
ncbi:protein borderless [Onthophagus taurus]|uniref:protein borderless n=1 Tax=Onthophagus taurus TaxID=166361 RepID=UPI0039BE835A